MNRGGLALNRTYSPGGYQRSAIRCSTILLTPDLTVKPFSPALYQELLWHLLLRGHDGFFLWCLAEELGEEARLVHEVYADSHVHWEATRQEGRDFGE